MSFNRLVTARKLRPPQHAPRAGASGRHFVQFDDDGLPARCKLLLGPDLDENSTLYSLYVGNFYMYMSNPLIVPGGSEKTTIQIHI